MPNGSESQRIRYGWHHWKAVLEDGTNRYRITYNPTRRTSVGKDQMEKLKNQHPDIYEEYTKTTESRTFRIKKEAA